MPWKRVRKKTPCGWEEEDVWVEEEKVKAPRKKKPVTPAPAPERIDVTKEFEKIKKKEPAVPA